MFQLAAGNVGYKICCYYNVVCRYYLCSRSYLYTSVSFIQTFSEKLNKSSNWIIIEFIIISTLSFVLIGKPVKVLLLIGALNGLILPVALGTLLVAAYKKSIVGGYKHPLWLTISGCTCRYCNGFNGRLYVNGSTSSII